MSRFVFLKTLGCLSILLRLISSFLRKGDLIPEKKVFKFSTLANSNNGEIEYITDLSLRPSLSFYDYISASHYHSWSLFLSIFRLPYLSLYLLVLCWYYFVLFQSFLVQPFLLLFCLWSNSSPAAGPNGIQLFIDAQIL